MQQFGVNNLNEVTTVIRACLRHLWLHTVFLMSFDRVLPVLTLVLGWFLNSWNPFFQERRENRRALCRALSELLEIRHGLVGRQIAMKEVHGKLPPTAERMMRNLVAKVLPSNDDVSKRYNAVVDLISSFDPLLGFKLRSKEVALNIGPTLSQLEIAAGQPLPFISEMEDAVTDVAIPHLQEVIIEVAGRHGRRMKRRVERQFESDQIPAQGEELLSLIRGQLQKLALGGLEQPTSQTASPVASNLTTDEQPQAKPQISGRSPESKVSSDAHSSLPGVQSQE